MKKLKQQQVKANRSSSADDQPVWRKVPRTVGLYEFLSSNTYFAHLRRGNKLYRESLKTKDLALAKRKLRDFVMRIDRTDPRYGKISFYCWLKDFYYPTLKGSESTLADKWRIIERIKRTWVAARAQPMRDVKPTEVERWLAEQFGDWSQSYYNTALSLVRHALSKAEQDRVLFDNPAAHLKYRKRQKPIRLTPNWEQFKAIIADVRSQRFNPDAQESADFLEFLGLAGLGQAEAAGMKREHVDLDAGRVCVYRHKTAQGFWIPIYPQARALIGRLCAGKKQHEYLFAINQARKALTNACKRLGFSNYSQRSLRRTFITRAIELGVDVKVIAQFQGHRNGGKLILDSYSHVRPQHALRMAALLTEEQPANVIPIPESTASA
jgi:integrase